MECVDVAGRPEVALKGLGAAIDAAQPDRMGEDDRPGPDAGKQQAEHHGLYDHIGLQEQVERRHEVGCCSQFRH
jgi:hypothetical protein